MNEKTILLVEDNPIDEELTLRALKKTGLPHQVVVTRDGAEALHYLFHQGPHASPNVNSTPALVLLDLKLPKLDGLDVLRRLRADERTRLLPVVMLTSSNQENDIAEAYGAGCNSYLQKTVEFLQFGEMAKYLVIYWLELNLAPPVPIKV